MEPIHRAELIENMLLKVQGVTFRSLWGCQLACSACCDFDGLRTFFPSLEDKLGAAGKAIPTRQMWRVQDEHLVGHTGDWERLEGGYPSIFCYVHFNPNFVKVPASFTVSLLSCTTEADKGDGTSILYYLCSQLIMQKAELAI